MAGRVGMTREEATFFKDTKVPLRLAAAAYFSSEDFNRLPMLDNSAQSKEIITELLRKISPDPTSNAELADWMLNIRVHIAIIPVEKPPAPDAPAGTRAPMEWDLAFVYRGTQPYSVTNWVTDFTFDQEPVEDYILPRADGESPLLVHSGFHRAFKGVHPHNTRDHTITLIDRLKVSCAEESPARHGSRDFHVRLAGAVRAKPRRILSIGHSLGGALATLGAAWCKTTLCSHKDYQGCDVQCITFGSPRVGNPAFARKWDQLLRDGNDAGEGKSYRIVNALDVAPSVPISVPQFQFQHVGVPVYLLRVVESWNVKMVPCLNHERVRLNTGSPLDHLPWHYAASMTAAEVTTNSTTPEERRLLAAQESLWLLSAAKQLSPSFMWGVFKSMLRMELPLPAHFWVLFVSWATALFSFVVGQAFCWLLLFPVIAFLLPAVSACFVVECVVTVWFLPFRLLLGSEHWTPWPWYTPGNFSLAILSEIVLVIAYVSAWVGL